MTSLHGVRRAYDNKSRSRIFWYACSTLFTTVRYARLVMVVFCSILTVNEVYKNLTEYRKHPVVSKARNLNGHWSRHENYRNPNF